MSVSVGAGRNATAVVTAMSPTGGAAPILVDSISSAHET